MPDLTIWRYALPLAETMPVELPEGAEILSVARRRGSETDVELWAKVDPAAARRGALEQRLLVTVGTGHRVPEVAGRFLGSLQFRDGAFVFHLFEAARDV